MSSHAESRSEVGLDDSGRAGDADDSSRQAEAGNPEVSEPAVEPDTGGDEGARVLYTSDGMTCPYCGAKVGEGRVDKRAYIDVYSKAPEGQDPNRVVRVGTCYWVVHCRRCKI